MSNQNPFSDFGDLNSDSFYNEKKFLFAGDDFDAELQSSKSDTFHDFSYQQRQTTTSQTTFVQTQTNYEVKEMETQVKKEEDIANGTSFCVICMDKAPEMIFMNCAHLCTCMACSQKLNECPICRSLIEKKIKVFIN